MHTYKEEIQLHGRNGDIVNAEASIHPDKDAQIPERVLDDLWKIIQAINLEDAVTIASLEAATSSGRYISNQRKSTEEVYIKIGILSGLSSIHTRPDPIQTGHISFPLNGGSHLLHFAPLHTRQVHEPDPSQAGHST
jgi:hypothetical protein